MATAHTNENLARHTEYLFDNASKRYKTQQRGSRRRVVPLRGLVWLALAALTEHIRHMVLMPSGDRRPRGRRIIAGLAAKLALAIPEGSSCMTC
jgi:hypothetical protein